MEIRRTSPKLERAPLVERQARKINDPVERLRYLRQAMQEQAEAGAAAVVPASAASRPAAWTMVSRPFYLHWAGIGLGCLILLAGTARLLQPKSSASASSPVVIQPSRPLLQAARPYIDTPAPRIWQVERHDEYETYSNGLRVENAFRTNTETRRYPRFKPLENNAQIADWSSTPAGIVFHTTEGQLVPFEAEQNKRLIRIGANLLAFIKQSQSYNFVIDRFGRVFRVVQESDTAYHAGHSVWADSQWAYVGLNHSFLGVAFESRTDPQEPVVTSAQLHAGRILTEMLRSQYKIPAANCVTHAQVSVNDSNMLIGAHTDWAGNFPFIELGLPSNYDLPLPSLYTFGFSYDPYFIKATGNRPWRGLQAADERIKRDAARLGLAVDAYRGVLRERYKKLVQTVKNGDTGEEKGDDRTE